MKKLIALLAILGFTPGAYAAGGADASHSGEFRLIYNSDMEFDLDEDAPDSPDQSVTQRLRWGTTVRAGEKLTGHFTLVHNADWGSNSDQIPGDGSTSATSTTAETANNTLIVNEAYMAWLASDAWAIKAGRGTHTLADGRFVSSNDWDPVMRAFDGIAAAYDHEFAKFTFFHVTGAKANTAGSFNDYGRFFGVNADFKSLPDWLKMASVHIVQVKRDPGTYLANGATTPALSKEDNMKIGVVLAGASGAVDYRFNYEMEDGENESGGAKTDISTSMIDAEVGYDFGAGRAHVGYHTDSGTSSGNDDETYDGFHYDRHNNAGLMDIFGWGNLTYLRVGANYNLNDEVALGAEYYMFSQTEKEDGYRNYDGTESAGLKTEDDLGTELDLWVTKKYSNNFSTMLRYGMFQAGDEFGNDVDDASQIYVEGKLTF